MVVRHSVNHRISKFRSLPIPLKMSQFFSELPWPFLIMLHFYPVTSLVAQKFASPAAGSLGSSRVSSFFFFEEGGGGERGLIS